MCFFPMANIARPPSALGFVVILLSYFMRFIIPEKVVQDFIQSF